MDVILKEGIDQANETGREILACVKEYGRGMHMMEHVLDMDEHICDMPYAELSTSDTRSVAEYHFVMNDELYLMYIVKNRMVIVKFDGESVEEIFNNTGYPSLGSQTCHFVYNGEIHVIGGTSSSNAFHRKFNGTEWVDDVKGNIYNLAYPSAVVKDGVVHVFGGSSSTSAKNHWTFDGTSWRQLANTGTDVYNWVLFVKDDAIHGIDDKNQLYRFDEAANTWILIDTFVAPTTSRYVSTYCHDGKYGYCYDYSVYMYDFDTGIWSVDDIRHTDLDMYNSGPLFVGGGVFYQNALKIYRFTNPYVMGYMLKGTKIYSNDFYKNDGLLRTVNKNVRFIAEDCAEVIENGDVMIDFITETPTYIIA